MASSPAPALPGSSFGRVARAVLLVTVGIGSAALGLKSFLLPNQFIDGGVVGIAILTSIKTGVPLAVLVTLINVPFIFLGYRQLGWTFALKSVAAILGLSLCLAFFSFPEVTNDKLLTAVFGGVFLGAGIGLCMRAECVLDGTEVAAILVSKRLHSSIGDVILVFNLIIFSVGAWVLSLEIALYSVLTYFSASKTVDFIIHGIEEYVAVTIVSREHERVRRAILEDLGRGVTILNGKRGYSGHNQEVLFCVFTRLEVPKLRKLITGIDPQAFLVTHRVDDIAGGLIKRRPFH
ncbi:MAG: YitT family protein [Catalinimonas sp.]